MSENTNFENPQVFWALASAGLVAGVSLLSLQSDAVGRYVLSPATLYSRRKIEYQNRWKNAFDSVRFTIRYSLTGGKDPSPANVEMEDEVLNTEFIVSPEELREFLSSRIHEVGGLRIGEIFRQTEASKEYLVRLYNVNGKIYQLPLVPCGRLLATQMEDTITTTTFCFVVDASGTAASSFIIEMVKEAKLPIFVLQNPLWMNSMAHLYEQGSLSRESLSKIIYAFCRLEGLRNQAQQPTILITLDQATLLPLLQEVFPDDRHVFAYQGAVNTVQYAGDLRKKQPRARITSSLEEALQFTNVPVTFTTPINCRLTKCANIMAPFVKALSQLPGDYADILETWMTSVDTFLTLKENEKENGYLPYVMKLDYMTMGDLDKGSTRYWAVRSLIQFVTGSRSREVPSETMDAVLSWLRDRPDPPMLSISNQHRKSISNAVFQHKLILIENKTLKDTVEPREHWTLKAALKRGCACCLPEDEEDAEDPPLSLRPVDSPLNSKVDFAKPVSSGYVDGKTQFAFDPSRFS